jgi:clan AA aspartic protease (TIGR02281 family)
VRSLIFAALLTASQQVPAVAEPLALRCIPISTNPEARKDPVASIEVTWTEHAWHVTHISAAGLRYQREQQYEMTIAPSGELGWNGTLRSRPQITMSGRIARVDQQYSYAETLFDSRKGGAAVGTMTATCAVAPLPVSQETTRAAFLIGVANDPQKPIVELGSALWSIIPASPGQPSSLAVRVEIDIPDQRLHATVTIRKNTDASLPATHTIDLRATFADGSEIKGVKDMGLPQLRKDDAPTGDAIAGVRVKINDSYFQVGLARSDTDAAHNLDLLATRNWFDFPLLLTNDRIAKLTFAKGGTGDRVMAQALDAWKGQSTDVSSTSQPTPQEYDPNAIAKLTATSSPDAFAPLAGAFNAWMRETYIQCWTQPSSMPTGAIYVAQVRVTLNADGSFASEPQLVNPPADASWRPFAESAMLAVIKCNPLKVPAEYAPYYKQWRVKTVHFDPVGEAPGDAAKTDDGSKFPETIKTDDERQSSLAPGDYASEIPLQKLNGTLVVPVSINGALTLNFVVDSGATDVSVPADVVLTLIRTGTLLTEDFLGTKTYRLADGSTFPSATFRIRSLKVGSREIENVVASVAKVEGSLLLGQSFLNRFKSWSIDNQRQLLLRARALLHKKLQIIALMPPIRLSDKIFPHTGLRRTSWGVHFCPDLDSLARTASGTAPQLQLPEIDRCRTIPILLP